MLETATLFVLLVAPAVTVIAAVLITAGRLGDIYGRRRLLVIGLATFGVTSLVACLAPNEDVLVAALSAQGAWPGGCTRRRWASFRRCTARGTTP